EALSTTAPQANGLHHLLVQAFWRDVLIVDLDTVDDTGAPLISRQQTGIDYLRTLGTPPVVLGPGSALWALGDTAVLRAPASTSARIPIGGDFALAPSGGWRWTGGGPR